MPMTFCWTGRLKISDGTAFGRTLVIGFGNPAREDDGIGPVVAERVEKLNLAQVTVDIDYQLSVEHAADVALVDTVVFVDASVDSDEPFAFSAVKPLYIESFSSHSMSPEQVMGMAVELFQAKTKGYLLGIRGYSFGMFREEMTAKASLNSQRAAEVLICALKSGDLRLITGEIR